MVKLSIVVATYNSESVIFACLKSISEQIFTDFEVIVIDGASIDSTVDIVKKMDLKNLVLISEPDNGVYSAWNKGLELAQGQWVTFIGSDDTYKSRYSLLEIMDLAQQNARSPFVYGALESIDNRGFAGHRTGSKWRKHDGFMQKFIFVSFPMPIMASLYRRDFIGDQRFDEFYRIAGDMDLVLRCLNRWEGGFPKFLDRTLVTMRVGGLSTNPLLYRTSIAEAYRFRRDNNLSNFNVGLTARTIKMFIVIIIVSLFGLHAIYKIKRFVRVLRRNK